MKLEICFPQNESRNISGGESAAPKVYGLVGGTAAPKQYWSSDGEWRGTLNGSTFTVERQDGWQLQFSNGAITSLRTDTDAVINWTYSSGKVSAITRSGSGIPELQVLYNSSQEVSGLRINGDQSGDR